MCRDTLLQTWQLCCWIWAHRLLENDKWHRTSCSEISTVRRSLCGFVKITLRGFKTYVLWGRQIKPIVKIQISPPPTPQPHTLVPHSDHMLILFTDRKRTSELYSRHQYNVILLVSEFGFSIYDMIWYDMIWYMIWHMICYDIIWYDMIWYMIWHMICYDIIWYDLIYVIGYDIWYDVWYMIWYLIWYIWYDIYDIWYDIWYMIWYDMI